MKDDDDTFSAERAARLSTYLKKSKLTSTARDFFLASAEERYSYNFDWLGRPVIQYPQDIVVMQELIWRTRPDLIIETGVARGGSLALYASMLALLDYCDAVQAGEMLDPSAPKRRVIGIDIDIRPHNESAMAAHPLANRIVMLQGSSTDTGIIAKVREIAKAYRRVLVCLDSNHTCEHVFDELQAYGSFVNEGSYCVVFDTVISQMPDSAFPDRPWGTNNNPQLAVDRYLEVLNQHEILANDGERLLFAPDHDIDAKLLISVAPGGYLQRVSARAPGR